MSRADQLAPNTIPRYVHCYDDGKSADRYTVVFTGRYRHKTGGEFWSLHMSAHPFHPQGIGLHDGHPQQIDYPRYSHLGKKVAFTDLPKDCQRLVRADYAYLWDIPLEHCGCCGEYHLPNFKGDCRDDSQRLWPREEDAISE